MRKTIFITLLILAFAVGTALAFGMPGAGGSSGLKKVVKKLSLGDANDFLRKYEGTPLAPQPVEYMTIGDAAFDDFQLRVAKLNIITGFVAIVINDANSQLDNQTAYTKPQMLKLQDNVNAASAALQPCENEVTLLLAKAPQLLTNLKSKLSSDPMLLADVVKAIDLDALKKIGQHVAGLMADLGTITSKIKDKIAALPPP